MWYLGNLNSGHLEKQGYIELVGMGYLWLPEQGYIYIYILARPPCIGSVINIERWSSLPRSEASGALGTIYIGLHATLYPIHQISVRSYMVLLVISVPSFRTSLPYSPSPS